VPHLISITWAAVWAGIFLSSWSEAHDDYDCLAYKEPGTGTWVKSEVHQGTNSVDVRHRIQVWFLLGFLLCTLVAVHSILFLAFTATCHHACESVASFTSKILLSTKVVLVCYGFFFVFKTDAARACKEFTRVDQLIFDLFLIIHACLLKLIILMRCVRCIKRATTPTHDLKL